MWDENGNILSQIVAKIKLIVRCLKDLKKLEEGRAVQRCNSWERKGAQGAVRFDKIILSVRWHLSLEYLHK